MSEYSPTWGVPFFSYYLVQILAFADFEVQQEEKILYTSRKKQDLVDLCEHNNWRLTGDWCEYEIRYRGII